MAVYRSLLEHGDKVLGMSLDHGGHLTHGHKLNFSGIDYEFYSYFVDLDKGTIDYEELEKVALEIKPKLIVAGASAYPRIIDFKRFREIADKCGAYLMVDMAHIAGLVATGYHPNPCEYADVVTSTTHKTLRSTRGGIILTHSEELIKKINKTVFPGIQGGPLMHVIAGKAVAFKEALEPSFKEYCGQIIKNAKTLEVELKEKGFKIVSGGTDNHLLLIDTYTSKGITGKECEHLLDKVGITVNKNSIPNDTLPPMTTSGIRIGTPAITTRGMKEEEMKLIAEYITLAIENRDNESKLEEIHKLVKELTSRFPLN